VRIYVHKEHQVGNCDKLGEVFNGRSCSYKQKSDHLKYIDVNVIVIVNPSSKSGIECDLIPKRVAGHVHDIVNNKGREYAKDECTFGPLVPIKVCRHSTMCAHLSIELSYVPWANRSPHDTLISVKHWKDTKN
jgi:hypothetical protein